MSETQVKLEVQEVEPTQEELELQAALQLMNEVFMIKRRIYGVAMNGVLLIQVKQLVRGLMRKYQECGMFKGEDIGVKFVPKQNAIDFTPTEGLRVLFAKAAEESFKAAQQKAETENESNV
jgi:hypothetical protein